VPSALPDKITNPTQPQEKVNNTAKCYIELQTHHVKNINHYSVTTMIVFLLIFLLLFFLFFFFFFFFLFDHPIIVNV
jgi:hypothetical protein